MLSEWIESLPQKKKPDVVFLSNALLTGLTQRLKEAAKAPVICWLQDEHVWTDAMHGSLKQAVIKTMRDNARHVDQFIAVSNYYRDVMSKRLNITENKITLIHPGVNLDKYILADATATPQTIGFLSRLSKEEGFETFVDAFIELRKDSRFKNVKIIATGGPSPDKKFLKRQRQKLNAVGLEKDIEISLDRFAKDRFNFLSELTILSVPGGSNPEAFGYYAIEALASAVPVVLPNHGAFPVFMMFDTGGILLNNTTPQNIAKTWAEILNSNEKLQYLSTNAQNYAKTTFNEKLITANIIKLLQRVCTDKQHISKHTDPL
jgi:glycosyltransferase involved in cell wall biosynthesis